MNYKNFKTFGSILDSVHKWVHISTRTSFCMPFSVVLQLNQCQKQPPLSKLVCLKNFDSIRLPNQTTNASQPPKSQVHRYARLPESDPGCPGQVRGG